MSVSESQPSVSKKEVRVEPAPFRAARPQPEAGPRFLRRACEILRRALHPTPYTLHPTHYTLNPEP